MSARVESAPIQGSPIGPLVLALIVALTVGALAGSLVTRSIVLGDGASAPAAPTFAGADAWHGRVLVAPQVGNEAAVAWDAFKLDAMAGRVLYQPVGAQPEVVMTAKPSITRPTPAIEGWDQFKLEAMAGRVLAAGVGAEDPPVKPHLPKRPPRG
jgi:hypothetical protein